jgi:hypothetical protein
VWLVTGEFDSGDFPADRHGQACDPLLLSLVSIMNTGAASCSISVMTAGGLIRGLLISRDVWLREWQESMTRAGGGVLAESYKTQFAQGHTVIDNDSLKDDTPSNLHIRNAFVGDIGPMYMRVALDSVAAWSMGSEPGNN